MKEYLPLCAHFLFKKATNEETYAALLVHTGHMSEKVRPVTPLAFWHTNRIEHNPVESMQAAGKIIESSLTHHEAVEFGTLIESSLAHNKAVEFGTLIESSLTHHKAVEFGTLMESSLTHHKAVGCWNSNKSSLTHHKPIEFGALMESSLTHHKAVGYWNSNKSSLTHHRGVGCWQNYRIQSDSP